MSKPKAPLTLDELYPHVEGLSTSEQLKLEAFLKKILDGKKEAAAKELDLLNGSK